MNPIIPKMNIPIYENYIPKGHPNRPGDRLLSFPWAAIVFHETGNFNSTAGDEMHQQYMGRAYKVIGGKHCEVDGTPFRKAGAQVFIDQDSISLVVPLNEVTWGCGDRQKEWDPVYKGQQRIAHDLFDNKQNYMVLNVEMCDNADWNKVQTNTVEFIANLLITNGIMTLPHDKYLLRHYDMTYKVCPSRMIDMKIVAVDPRWVEFKQRIIRRMAELSNPKKYYIYAGPFNESDARSALTKVRNSGIAANIIKEES